MILVLLEDDARVARGLVRLIFNLGHTALHASTVAEAKALLARQSVDLVVADLGLQDGESGLEFLSWVRETHPRVRRVLTSGALRPAAFALAPPEQAFLSKPFGRAELAELLGVSSG